MQPTEIQRHVYHSRFDIQQVTFAQQQQTLQKTRQDTITQQHQYDMRQRARTPHREEPSRRFQNHPRAFCLCHVPRLLFRKVQRGFVMHHFLDKCDL